MSEKVHEMNREICFVDIKLEEDNDCFDNQALVDKTVNLNSSSKINDPLTEYEASILNNVKKEMRPDNIQYNELNNVLNVENQFIIKSELTESTPKIKIEYENNLLNEAVFFPENSSLVSNNDTSDEVTIKDEIISPPNISEQLYCKNCHESYEEYCIKCQMLIHILDRNVLIKMNNRARAEVPRHMLELRESPGHVGIFALKFIPKGVTFGPFTGLNSLELFWKIKGGRFVVSNDKLKFLNWMQYIDNAKNISEQNLLVFQCEGNLYYRSTCEIGVGDELLVYYGEEYEDNLNKDVEMRFIPATEAYIKTVFACISCCLGFNSKVHLIEHKTMCPNKNDGSSSIDDIIQCLFCKIYMGQKEYLQYHMDYCYEKNASQCLQPISESPMLNVNHCASVPEKPKRQCRKTYNCSKCSYKTTYKSDLKNHASKHYEVKTYSCTVCLRRFKRRETFKRHMISTHDTDFKQGQNRMLLWRKYKCAKCEYETYVLSHFKNHLISHKTAKQLKCSDCEFRTNYKYNLTAHRLEKHVSAQENVQQLKCSQCDYATHRKDCYKAHLDKHDSDRRFKCSKCDYETYQKYYLKRHFYRHETVKRFKCTQCEFVTNFKAKLRVHCLDKHSTLREIVKRFSCLDCDYSTNSKSDFTYHTYTHGTVKRFKCSCCNYGTNRRSDLKRHTDAKHVKIKTYKCSKCDYETTSKNAFETHHYTHYDADDERKFVCLTCGYRSKRKSNLTVHINAKHSSNGEKYKCSECDFKTGIKGCLERHVYVHTGVKQHNCSECKFGTNYKWILNKHKNAKHSGMNEVTSLT